MTRYLLLIFFSYATGANAQTFKRFHFKDGAIRDLPINTIDSLTYPTTQQVSVHLNTGQVLPYALSTIDSVSFFFYTPFNTALTYGAVTDIEGNTYKTLQIGTQIWMAENLRVTKFRNNVAIQSLSDSLLWANVYDNNTQIPLWCYYQNEASNQLPYGKLYNWHAVVNAGGLCPHGRS
jgi:hypothetical protein